MNWDWGGILENALDIAHFIRIKREMDGMGDEIYPNDALSHQQHKVGFKSLKKVSLFYLAFLYLHKNEEMKNELSCGI